VKQDSARPAQARSATRNDPEEKALVVRDDGPSAVDIVRDAIAEFEKTGQPRPGRPTLIKLTGLTGHQVLKALKELDAEDAQQESTAVDSRDRWQMLRQWPLFLMGLAAGVSVWSGWVGLGQMTGFGLIQPLPGLADDFRINTSIMLPISVEAYGAYALGCWLTANRYSPRTVRFAKWSAFISLSVGFLAQAVYHLMASAGMTRAPWPIIVLVAGVPVAVLGLASALAKMVTSDRRAAEADDAGVE
jgi:hypothetical protein